MEAHTLEYASPTLVYFVLKNAKTGAELGKSTPQAAPPGDQRLEFTPGETGDCLLEVQHLHFAGGPSESYRITVRPATAGFEVVLPADRFNVSAGGAGSIPVQVVRKGYTGPIELTTSGSTGLQGSATIKTAQNTGVLMLTAKENLAMGAYPLTVFGKASIDGKMVIRAASTRVPIVQALNGLPYPPLNLLTSVAVAVTERPPFSLAITMDPPEGVPGGAAQ